MALAGRLYTLAAALPQVELCGIGAQIRRAAVSVPSNIAGGYGRRATGEYRHHVSIARGSVLELETLVLLCAQLGYVPAPQTSDLLDEIDQLSRMLYTLVNRLR
jgi:four helix bundle protein